MPYAARSADLAPWFSPDGDKFALAFADHAFEVQRGPAAACWTVGPKLVLVLVKAADCVEADHGGTVALQRPDKRGRRDVVTSCDASIMTTSAG